MHENQFEKNSRLQHIKRNEVYLQLDDKKQDWLRSVLRTLQGGLVWVKILNGSCKPKWQGCEHNMKFEEKTHLHFIKD